MNESNHNNKDIEGNKYRKARVTFKLYIPDLEQLCQAAVDIIYPAKVIKQSDNMQQIEETCSQFYI